MSTDTPCVSFTVQTPTAARRTRQIQRLRRATIVVAMIVSLAAPNPIRHYIRTHGTHNSTVTRVDRTVDQVDFSCHTDADQCR